MVSYGSKDGNNRLGIYVSSRNPHRPHSCRQQSSSATPGAHVSRSSACRKASQLSSLRPPQSQRPSLHSLPPRSSPPKLILHPLRVTQHPSSSSSSLQSRSQPRQRPSLCGAARCQPPSRMPARLQTRSVRLQSQHPSLLDRCGSYVACPWANQQVCRRGAAVPVRGCQPPAWSSQ